MTKVLVLDTETTGISNTDEPIEVAATLYEADLNGNLVAKVDSYCGRREPSVPISFMAQKVHKITKADLIGRDFDHDKLKTLISNADIIVAHNADFDARMLEPLYPEIKSKSWRCTLNQWPWPPAMGKSLSSIALTFEVPHIGAHSAEGDVETLGSCLFHPSGGGNYLKTLLQADNYVLKNNGQNSFKRVASSMSPEVNQAYQSLLDIVGAIVSDEQLHDSEIKFINEWIMAHSTVALKWPGSFISQQVKQILEDGFISEDERSFLLSSLKDISQGTLERVSQAAEEGDFRPDELDTIDFSSHTFCLSGNFVYGDKDKCADEITKRGGLMLVGVTKKLNYLIVGGLGNDQWKHGNFGTKVEKAIQYRSDGIPIKIVHEEAWTKFL
ncbi:MAG: exonuclease domain-containing protein [Polynucleobacter sp.]|uniref:exonuclease domain-containing protein n=1 Tax=Polynucleobacter sp. TaxID=2029855 RepID=UPI00271B408C|nr:exonuclease domain-containing protein [Polynucleobacter sp.]MDO8712931.1 exonuclease domain-containing protein [Polynucleobacter sp.]